MTARRRAAKRSDARTARTARTREGASRGAGMSAPGRPKRELPRSAVARKVLQ